MNKKAMNLLTSASLVGMGAAACYVMLKTKKNMLDVIIEEIETLK